MGNKPFTTIAAILFAVAALLHLYRAAFSHFRVVFGSHEISQTVSIVAVVVAAIMSWGLYRESRR
jgi:uncharacterized membrane protein required for colicin V production